MAHDEGARSQRSGQDVDLARTAESFAGEGKTIEDDEPTENAELVLFQVKECYVYLIPPRKSAASYRADEWNINKWNWEGVLKVVTKGEDCTIKLEDITTGELYAQAPIRGDQPLPVEAVIDSSRFFVLRIEDNSGPQLRHAFIGIGFRDRLPAYDFQAAVYDHMKYLNKKKHAEEIEQEYQSKPSVDYSLKDGETLRLNLNTSRKPSGSSLGSNFFDQNLDSSQIDKGIAVPPLISPPTQQTFIPFLVPPPPPRAIPDSLLRIPSNKLNESETEAGSLSDPSNLQDDADEDFGDFQTAGENDRVTDI